MSRATIGLEESLHHYITQRFVRESPGLAGLREATTGRPGAQMQISPEQGQFMMLLARLIGARYAIEIGTYTGYSTLWLAHGLQHKGRIIACDIDETMPAIGKPYWAQDGLAHLIDLRIAPALQTLDNLLTGNHQHGAYDLIFIDADKQGYSAYFERGLKLLRAGGLMMIDNTLWGGTVIDDAQQDKTTTAIRTLNDALAADTRADISLVPIGDGLTLARKLSM